MAVDKTSDVDTKDPPGAVPAAESREPTRGPGVASEERPRPLGRGASMKPLILVVEDEAALITLLHYNLEREGFRVAEARDGEEGLMMAAELKPDLILLDWMLPLVSGLEVCRRPRRAPATRRTPIMILTARAEEADRLRGLDVGADDYLLKPFIPTELVARIRAVLRRARPGAEAET